MDTYDTSWKKQAINSLIDQVCKVFNVARFFAWKFEKYIACQSKDEGGLRLQVFQIIIITSSIIVVIIISIIIIFFFVSFIIRSIQDWLDTNP